MDRRIARDGHVKKQISPAGLGPFPRSIRLAEFERSPRTIQGPRHHPRPTLEVTCNLHEAHLLRYLGGSRRVCRDPVT